MKIALVHDDLIQFGGAERLVMALHELWPDAPLYTSVASPQWLKICKEKNINLKTSFMQHLPFKTKLNRAFAPMLFHVLGFESFDFSQFDVVLSVSARFAHGVVTKPTTKHICYMNSPGRMIWESHDYFRYEKQSLLKMLGYSLLDLRLWDFAAAQRVDYFIANSSVPQARIKKFYKRDSIIIHPFISIAEYQLNKYSSADYFLIISRLLPWKQIALAIHACNKLALPLKIIGEGPDKDRLKNISGPTVEILGYVSEEEKKICISNCLALIVTQYEDFGITPLEAMALGKPVIAYGKGGVLDTVINQKTGMFFEHQTVDSLVMALQNFNPTQFLKSDCLSQAKRFDRQYFEKNIKDFVNAVYLEALR